MWCGVQAPLREFKLVHREPARSGKARSYGRVDRADPVARAAPGLQEAPREPATSGKRGRGSQAHAARLRGRSNRWIRCKRLRSHPPGLPPALGGKARGHSRATGGTGGTRRDPGGTRAALGDRLRPRRAVSPVPSHGLSLGVDAGLTRTPEAGTRGPPATEVRSGDNAPRTRGREQR